MIAFSIPVAAHRGHARGAGCVVPQGDGEQTRVGNRELQADRLTSKPAVELRAPTAPGSSNGRHFSMTILPLADCPAACNW